MIKKLAIILGTVLLMVAAYRYNSKEKVQSPDDLLPVKVLSFRTATGWGYEVEVDGKVFIHQDNIPAVQGNKSFQSSDDARKVGDFVVEKMKNNQKPIITVEELKSMGIKDI